MASPNLNPKNKYEPLFDKLVKRCIGKEIADFFLDPYEKILKSNECEDKISKFGNDIKCIDKKWEAQEAMIKFLEGIYNQASDKIDHIYYERSQNHDIVELLDLIDDNLGLDTHNSYYLPKIFDAGYNEMTVDKDDLILHGNVPQEDLEYLDEDPYGYVESLYNERLPLRQKEFKEYISYLNQTLDYYDKIINVFDTSVNKVHSGGSVIVDYLWREDITSELLDDEIKDADYQDFVEDIINKTSSKIGTLVNILGRADIQDSKDIQYLKQCINDVVCQNKENDYARQWKKCLVSKRG